MCGARVEVEAELPDFRLFRCTACGCRSSDALERGATTSFEPADYFGNADCDRAKWERLARIVEARGAAPASVLDVGCGNGAYLRWVAERWPEATRTGVELDTERAEEARAGDAQAEIFTGDALDTVRSLEPRFDLITLWDVFEHVPAPAALLAELGAHLTPGGALYIQTIHETSVLPAVGRLAYRLTGGRVSYPLRRTHEPHHLVFFTREGLERGAREANLVIRERWFDRLAFERMDGHPLVKMATSCVLAIENGLGNGLFINLVLERADGSAGPHRS